MKKWNFKIKNNTKNISEKLESALRTVDGFVLNIKKVKNDSLAFRLRKRGLYAFQVIFQNKIIVNGKIIKTNTKNETDLEISFTQDFLTKLILFIFILSGLGLSLIAIISKTNNNSYMLIVGGILLIIGIALWVDINRRFEKNIQKYKALISGILEA
ncbi:DUF423 domain-containing protein [Flavobacterium sp.]|uniref:DUF423 domain-containing protein n=1 Tax=Flavobacterium sp. TaxID=239 RepID=UPI002603F70E|nr:DUF423 domain-containing protein [Flavobacterium sp.]MDD2987088.1 DUF423 domain-containing protein [Flavobacterium sp.]